MKIIAQRLVDWQGVTRSITWTLESLPAPWNSCVTRKAKPISLGNPRILFSNLFGEECKTISYKGQRVNHHPHCSWLKFIRQKTQIVLKWLMQSDIWFRFNKPVGSLERLVRYDRYDRYDRWTILTILINPVKFFEEDKRSGFNWDH